MKNTNHSLIEPQAIREFRELREETIALALAGMIWNYGEAGISRTSWTMKFTCSYH